jgi:hypothetical protein
MTCNPAYRQAMALAWTALDGISPRDLARGAGADLKGEEIILTAFADEVSVDLRDRFVMTPPELAGPWGLIALHHLKGCLGWKRDDEWLSFEQLPGARPFAAAFRERAVAPLAARFGVDPKELLRSGRPLGCRPLSMGDSAASFQAFPKLRLAVVIWRGDSEVPAGANLLFDKGGAATLPAEDLAEIGISLSQMLVSKVQ